MSSPSADLSIHKTISVEDKVVPESASTKRRSTRSVSSGPNSGIISDATILCGVRKEFTCTLPFWRCWVDVKRLMRSNPVLMECEISLLCRLPCQVFSGVDVVWAVADARVRVKRNVKRRRGEVSAPSCVPAEYAHLSQCWRSVQFKEHQWKLGTMHFVHHNAHRNRNGDSRSYHIQSVVFENQLEIMQCVAGTMLGFAFVIYSSLLHLEQRACAQAVTPPAARGRTLSSNEAGFSTLDGEATGQTAPKDSVKSEPQPTALPSAWSASSGTLPVSEGERRARLRALCPPPLRRILILGMGGNSMALSLRHALGAQVELHVVEIEPAVLQACERAGTLPSAADDAHFHVHLEDAVRCLKDTLAAVSFDMIFMDLFEPTKGKMRNDMRITNLCFDRLQVGGLLVVNVHRLPSFSSLKPYGRLFGYRNVQTVNLHGWNESVVVCMRPSSAPSLSNQDSAQGAVSGGELHETCARDGLSLQCEKNLANSIFSCYEEVLPGWLPHYSWLKSSRKVGEGVEQCRIWNS